MNDDKKKKPGGINPFPGDPDKNENNIGDIGNQIPYVPPKDRTNLAEGSDDFSAETDMSDITGTGEE